MKHGPVRISPRTFEEHHDVLELSCLEHPPVSVTPCYSATRDPGIARFWDAAMHPRVTAEL